MRKDPSTAEFRLADLHATHLYGTVAVPSGTVFVLGTVGRALAGGRLKTVAPDPRTDPLVASDDNKDPHGPSAYLMLERRTLGQACRDNRRDDGGRRCPTCDLRDLCEGQTARPAPSAV